MEFLDLFGSFLDYLGRFRIFRKILWKFMEF
jgi:hypothetical protein